MDEARHAPAAGPARTLYLGGGTPGLLEPGLLGVMIECMCKLFSFSSDLEITLEVNPANVSLRRLEQWRQLGVTRLSLGVQTFRDDVLRGLGRRHDSRTALSALEEIAAHWSATWSADLLVGWSGQDTAALADDLARLAAFSPPHVSVYGLTVEPGTPLASRARRGLPVTAPTGLLDRFDGTWARYLGSLGYERYEVSNFARPGHRSRHNQAYWANASYLGFGPGASSSIHPHRWTNRADLSGYIAAARRGQGTRQMTERLDPTARLLETLAVGLRTLDGLAEVDMDQRFGRAWKSIVSASGTELVHAGMLTLANGRLRIPAEHLTKADRIVLDLAVEIQAAEATDERSLAGGHQA
jgi:oxygen-independent coproporphyrinogen-3 oxidase